jgi:REP element-mobilizing transposase RayT
MGRARRVLVEPGVYFVTARTMQSRHLLRPGSVTNALVAGVLARSVRLSGVRLHGFVVMSNHLHLLVSAEGVQLPRLMQHLLGNVSKKVGRVVGWKGSFWERRYAMQPVLDDGAAEGRLRYIVAHGVKEGLVRRSEEWPGLSCLELLRGGGAMETTFFHWARRWSGGGVVKGGAGMLEARWGEAESLVLAPLPSWVGLTTEARRARVEAMTEDIAQEWVTRHRRVKGAEAVLAERPQRRPRATKRTVAPRWLATDLAASQRYEGLRAAWLATFLVASLAFRSGLGALQAFPLDAFSPPAAHTKPPGIIDHSSKGV